MTRHTRNNSNNNNSNRQCAAMTFHRLTKWSRMALVLEWMTSTTTTTTSAFHPVLVRRMFQRDKACGSASAVELSSSSSVPEELDLPSALRRRSLVLANHQNHNNNNNNGLQQQVQGIRTSAVMVNDLIDRDIVDDDDDKAWMDVLQSKEVRQLRDNLIEKYVLHGKSRELAQVEVDLFLRDKKRSQTFLDMRRYAAAQTDDLAERGMFLPGLAVVIGCVVTAITTYLETFHETHAIPYN